MPCYKPIEVPIKRSLMYTKRDHYDMQVVPCGICIGCRAEQTRQWAVRMMHQVRMHDSSVFCTLTLDDEHLNENRELDSKDLSGFIKSLRKTQERPLSFYGCGEYGEITNRPHYHAVLFGVEFLDTVDRVDDRGRDFRWSKTLEDTWGRGICEVGSVTMASASYVSGYMRKKVKASKYERANPITGEMLKPEFARMSVRPAIGKDWIKKWWTDVYPRDYVVVDGVEAKPPRYYDKWMDFPDEKGGTKERRDIMEDVRKQRYIDAIELTPMQLKAGEAIHQSRTNLFASRGAI